MGTGAGAAGAEQWTFHGSEMSVAMRPGGGGLAGDLGAVRPGEVRLAGDLSAVPPADVLQLISITRRSGLFFTSCSQVERCLLFIEGNVGWATSTLPEERVHEVFCRLDLAGRAALLSSRLGLEARDAVKRQIQRVVAGIIGETSGAFALVDAPAMGIPRAAALDTQQLIMRSVWSDAG